MWKIAVNRQTVSRGGCEREKTSKGCYEGEKMRKRTECGDPAEREVSFRNSKVKPLVRYRGLLVLFFLLIGSTTSRRRCARLFCNLHLQRRRRVSII